MWAVARPLAAGQFIVPRAAADPCLSATCLYLDTDVASGTHTGTQANPFNALGTAQWTVINSALASGNVILYCSARGVSSDTNQTTSLDVAGWRKTPNPGHRFTFDGTSVWNSDDTTPNWAAYSGSSKCQVNRYNTQDRSSNSQLINDWTLNGLQITSTLGKILSICGNNVIIQNSEIFHAVGTSAGNTPMILIDPVADAIHEGSSAPCPQMTTAPTFTNNTIHDSAGELIYGGNGGARLNDTNGFDTGSGSTFDIARGGATYTPTLTAAGSGYVVNEKLFVLGATLGGSTGNCCHDLPDVNDLLITITGIDGSGGITTFSWNGTSTGSGTTVGVAPVNNSMGMSAGHQNLTLTGNTLYNCGSRGSQGDCIDLKGGWQHVLVTRGDISNNLNSGDFRCIVTQGTVNDGRDQDIVIDRTNIHDCLGVSQGAITLSNSWGIPNGVTLRNSLVTGTTGGAAFYSNQSQASPGVNIFSSTIYNNSGNCLTGVAPTTWTVTNTVCLSNNGGGAQISGGTFTADHNGYGGTWSGTCTSCVASLTTAAFTNAAGGDFTLTSGSVLRDVGATIASFATDYIGTTRPKNGVWDIGAYEYIP